MPSKILGLVLCLALASMALAQNKTYKVQKGDTISEIAAKFKVKRADLVAANGLENPNKLKLGMNLQIPGTAAGGPTPTGYYIARNGDHGWSVARRYNLSTEKLQKLNPTVNVSKLTPGMKLAVGASKEPTVEVKAVKVGSTNETVAPKAEPAKSVGDDLYVVKEGDNDWVIAHNLGLTSTQIHQLNPNVDWRTLQIGTKLKIPSGTVAKAKVSSKISTRYAVVAGDNVVIRRKPTTESEKITLVSKGTQVTVLDEQSGWYKLKFPKGTIGWMRGDMLKPLSTLSAAKVVRSERGSKASKRTTAVAKLPSKSKSKSRSSSRVASKSKSSKSSTIRVASSTPRSSVDSGDLLDKAMSLRGTRYRWGGTSRSGFDCSGFVGTVYKSQGVKLPRVSRDMAQVGAKVAKDELKPGDLVFFRTGSRNRISHVGIYAGEGKFIHSSSGKGSVRVDSLKEGYYAKRLVTAKRVAKPAAKPEPPKSKEPEKQEPEKQEPEKQEPEKKEAEKKEAEAKPKEEDKSSAPDKTGN